MIIQAPAVSVVISFFNAEKFIEESILSVFSQTFEDWELLLIDDGSMDQSTEIARRFSTRNPQRIKYFEHPERRNRGQAASRNVGVNNARGKYLAILDADDVWLPNKLQEQIEIMKSHPEAALVCGLSRYWYSWTGQTADLDKDFVEDAVVPTDRLYEPPSLLAKRINFEWCPCPSDMMLNREALMRLGGFEESFAGMYGMYEDQALVTKFALKVPIFVAGQSWTGYRIHDDSMCAVQSKAGNELAIRRFYLEWLQQYLSESGAVDAKIWRGFRRSQWLSRHPKLARADALMRRVPRAIARRVGGAGLRLT
jgi:glycosyltransferase involved in cell wall biosynthesis